MNLGGSWTSDFLFIKGEITACAECFENFGIFLDAVREFAAFQLRELAEGLLSGYVYVFTQAVVHNTGVGKGRRESVSLYSLIGAP